VGQTSPNRTRTRKTGARAGGADRREKPCPSTPADPHGSTDHQGLLWGCSADYFPAAHAKHLAAEPAGQSRRVSHVYSGAGRRQRRDHHPRRARIWTSASYPTRPSAHRCGGRGMRPRGTRRPGLTSTSRARKSRRQGACSRTAGAKNPIEAAVDRHNDGNAFSFYYYSRLDIHRAGW